MSTLLNLSLRNSHVDDVAAAIDGGGAAATLTVYDGTQPTDVETAVSTQVALAAFTLPYPALPVASGGEAAFNIPAGGLSVAASATGVATWFRVTDSLGAAVADGDVDTANAALVLDTTSLVSGQTVTIPSGKVMG